MATPAQVVEEQFSQARTYADNLLTEVNTFTGALSDALYTAPLVDIEWAPVEAPTVLTVPERPAALDALEAEFEWDAGGTIAAAKPTTLDVTAPDIVIDDFDVAAPTLTFPDEPVLDFGTAPVLDFGDRPTIPTVETITVPTAPTVTLPDTPTYLTLSTPTFGGLDLHEDWLTALQDVPELDLVAPTPYSYTLGAEYASTLLSTLKTTLNTRLSGGTGLDEDVEQALWDRLRSREVQLGAANEAEVTRTHEALGFQLPTGALAAQLRAAQQDTINRISTAARDISIKQADLEQSNLRDTITAGMQLESRLIDYSFNLERLSFETAKQVADNAVQVHNGQLEAFKATQASFELYARAYGVIIDAEKAKIEVYRAQLAGEQAKADTNRTLVEQYKATIDAGLSQVKVFEAQVGAARTLMELEQVKIAAAGEQIKAYVAGINGETARVEAYKVGVQAQSVRMESYKVGVDAQLSRVKVYEAQAGAFTAKASAQGDKARTNLAYYTARVQAKSAEWDGWRARVQGETARFEALASKSNAVLDAYKAETSTVLAEAEQDIKRWSTQIGQYQAQQNYTLQVSKINTEVIQANRQATLEAAKAGAQIFAQLTASAMGMIRASASVGATASNSVGYTYANDTTSAVAPVTAV